MIQDITVDKLVEWRNIVASRSSETNYNNYHRHIRAILNYCVKRGLLAENPINRISQFKHGNIRGKAITIEAFKTVCRYLESAEHPLAAVSRTLLLVFYFTGMRRTQVCGLRWNNVDFDNDTIALRKEYSKTGREWKIPLEPRLKGALVELKKKALKVLGNGFRLDDQVFWMQLYHPRYSGNRFTPDQCSGLFRRLAKKTATKISAHKIRHLVATTLANCDRSLIAGQTDVPITLTAVQALLGHENIMTTTMYIEPNLQSQRNALKGLDNL